MTVTINTGIQEDKEQNINVYIQKQKPINLLIIIKGIATKAIAVDTNYASTTSSF